MLNKQENCHSREGGNSEVSNRIIYVDSGSESGMTKEVNAK